MMSAFAALESNLASVSLAAFENIRLTDGIAPFGAVLDRAVETMGEFRLTGERRDRITVLKSLATHFVPGLEIGLDADSYTTDEILAMPASNWKLDRKESDDGLVVVWWLK